MAGSLATSVAPAAVSVAAATAAWSAIRAGPASGAVVGDTTVESDVGSVRVATAAVVSGTATGATTVDLGGTSMSTASLISVVTSWVQRRTSAMALPTWRPASGNRFGPRTIRATTRMTRISAGPRLVGMG